MEFIYPESGSTITIPLQLSGRRKGIVCSLAHSDDNATVYWHLDNSYIGETRYLHQMTLSPAPGDHIITVTDSEGNTLSTRITVK